MTNLVILGCIIQPILAEQRATTADCRCAILEHTTSYSVHYESKLQLKLESLNI